jgi:hypothetical protein
VHGYGQDNISRQQKFNPRSIFPLSSSYISGTNSFVLCVHHFHVPCKFECTLWVLLVDFVLKYFILITSALRIPKNKLRRRKICPLSEYNILREEENERKITYLFLGGVFKLFSWNNIIYNQRTPLNRVFVEKVKVSLLLGNPHLLRNPTVYYGLAFQSCLKCAYFSPVSSAHISVLSQVRIFLPSGVLPSIFPFHIPTETK